MKFTSKLVVLLLVLTASFSIPSAFSYSKGPSVWGNPEYANFVTALINPNDATVQQKLLSLVPIQDSAHFGQNLLNVYNFVSQLPTPSQTDEDQIYGANWMSASEILQFGQGDCKNHAILLITLIEALYKNTFGNLPTDLVWMMGGGVDPAGDGNVGGHVWVLLNMDEIQSVSQDAFNLIRGVSRATGTGQVPLGAEPPWSYVMNWVNVNFDSLPNRSGLIPTQSIISLGHFYVELEATWREPISEFYYKKYPFVEIHDQWNSYEYHRNPQVTPPSQGGSLQLSSTTWHYGDTITWSASGLTPNGAISSRFEGGWGTLLFGDTTADSQGRAGFSFVLGTNIPGSGRFIIVDKSKNVFLSSDYTIASKIGAVTVNVFSTDLSYLGRDPSQQRDLGAVIAATFVVGGVKGTVSKNTPFTIQVDPFSTIMLSVISTPSGYNFATKWDDYYGASQFSGSTFTYNVLALVNHKAAAFFSLTGISQVAVDANSVALGQLGQDPTQQPDLHATLGVNFVSHGQQQSTVITTPNRLAVDSGSTIVFSVLNIPNGYGFANQWDDYYGASQFKGATFSYNVGSSNHKTAAFFTNQQSPTSASLQLSSSTWHYGQTVSWSASGLTANGPVSVTLQGSGWTLPLWDTTADSGGSAGYSFVVGTNIPSSGNLLVIDKTTGAILTISYTLT